MSKLNQEEVYSTLCQNIDSIKEAIIEALAKGNQEQTIDFTIGCTIISFSGDIGTFHGLKLTELKIMLNSYLKMMKSHEKSMKEKERKMSENRKKNLVYLKKNN